MNECKNYKTITKTIDLASGSAASSYEYQLDFGKEYGRVIGYYAILSTAGGLTNAQIKLGFADEARTVIDPTLLDHWICSSSVPINERFYKCDPINMVSGRIKATLVTAAATVSALQLQIVAQVERKN